MPERPVSPKSAPNPRLEDRNHQNLPQISLVRTEMAKICRKSPGFLQESPGRAGAGTGTGSLGKHPVNGHFWVFSR